MRQTHRRTTLLVFHPRSSPSHPGGSTSTALTCHLQTLSSASPVRCGADVIRVQYPINTHQGSCRFLQKMYHCISLEGDLPWFYVFRQNVCWMFIWFPFAWVVAVDTHAGTKDSSPLPQDPSFSSFYPSQNFSLRTRGHTQEAVRKRSTSVDLCSSCHHLHFPWPKTQREKFPKS